MVTWLWILWKSIRLSIYFPRLNRILNSRNSFNFQHRWMRCDDDGTKLTIQYQTKFNKSGKGRSKWPTICFLCSLISSVFSHHHQQLEWLVVVGRSTNEPATSSKNDNIIIGTTASEKCWRSKQILKKKSLATIYIYVYFFARDNKILWQNCKLVINDDKRKQRVIVTSRAYFCALLTWLRLENDD